MQNKRAWAERIIIISLTGILILLIMAGSSLGQIQKRGETENIISSGIIRVKLLNELEGEEKMPEVITNILPGDTINNIIKIENICDYDEYIRVSLKKEIFKSEDSDEKLDGTKASFIFNEKDWVYKDGYYYYIHTLKAKDKSTPLYTGIHFDESIDDEYKLACLNEEIVVEAVQSDNNGTALTAEGWQVKIKVKTAKEDSSKLVVTEKGSDVS